VNRDDSIRRLNEIERRYAEGIRLFQDDFEFLFFHARHALTGIAAPEHPRTPGSRARGAPRSGGESAEEDLA
jgi:hypothetical protein